MASLVYRQPLLYQAVMRILHGRHFQARYQAVARHVPPGARVLELCMGDAYLYRHYLRDLNVRYIGLDSSPSFVAKARARGVEAHLCNIETDPLPVADVVVMQASLFHFPETHESLVERMVQAAAQTVILAEPVINMASSKNPLLAMLGRRLTKPQGAAGAQNFRFDESSFRALLSRFPECRSVEFEPGGRELVALLKGSAPEPTAPLDASPAI